MIFQTEYLILREMDQNDYDARYTVLADSDILAWRLFRIPAGEIKKADTRMGICF